MKRISASAVLVLMLCVAANATEVTYDLPTLTGPTPYSTMTTVIYDGAPGAVNALSFRLEGTLDQIGLMECFGSVPPDTLEWPLSLGGLLRRAGESGRWNGSAPFVDQLGGFDHTFTLHTFSGGFSTLATGDTLEAWIEAMPAILVGICGGIIEPEGTVTRVTLTIDVQTATPVQTSTWGRIKSLYR